MSSLSQLMSLYLEEQIWMLYSSAEFSTIFNTGAPYLQIVDDLLLHFVENLCKT